MVLRVTIPYWWNNVYLQLKMVQNFSQCADNILHRISMISSCHFKCICERVYYCVLPNLSILRSVSNYLFPRELIKMKEASLLLVLLFMFMRYSYFVSVSRYCNQGLHRFPGFFANKSKYFHFVISFNIC